MEASRTAYQALSSAPGGSHTVRLFEADVDAMVHVLLQNAIATEKPKRRLQEGRFVDRRRKGFVSLEKGWLRKYLMKVSDEDSSDAQVAHLQIEDPDDIK